jgi:hypothetical protein
MRLRRGRLCLRLSNTDSRKCGGRRSISAAPCYAPAFGPTCRPRLRPPASLRRQRRCIAYEAPHHAYLFTRARRQGSHHAACGLRPPEVSWPLLSLRGNWGGFAPANWLMPPRRRSPPLSRRGAWKEERCSLCCKSFFDEVVRMEFSVNRRRNCLGATGSSRNRFDGGCAPPNPAPLAAAGVRGELW